MAQQVGREDRSVGQVLAEHRLPAPAVSGQAVDRQNLGLHWRPEAVGVQHGADVASCFGARASRARVVGPSWCHSHMSAPHTELTMAALGGRGLRGTFRVLGGAGTGKSTLLVDTAVAQISAGCDPESVLLLTGSAGLGAQAKAAITATLLSSGDRTVVREPLVRTVHSYAFAVLRLAAQRNGSPPPRFITSAEQDGIIG